MGFGDIKKDKFFEQPTILKGKEEPEFETTEEDGNDLNLAAIGVALIVGVIGIIIFSTSYSALNTEVMPGAALVFFESFPLIALGIAIIFGLKFVPSLGGRR